MMKRVALSLVVLPLVASVAHADGERVAQVGDEEEIAPPSAMLPVATPAAAPPAPQNEDWSNVSNINGTPVKVGERHEYLYSYKKLNVAVDPFGPFWGYWEGAAQYAVSPHVAISGGLSAYSKDGKNEFTAQVTAPIYFRKVFSGPFLEPGLVTRSTSYDSMSTYDTNHSWVGPTLMFGWHWNFDSGLNVSWALGVVKPATDSSSSSQDPQFNGYFRVGYNF